MEGSLEQANPPIKQVTQISTPHSNNFVTIGIVAIVFLILGFLGGYLLWGLNSESVSNNQSNDSLSSTNTSPSPVNLCVNYGLQEPESYLVEYIAKNGDTPKSIIIERFGNTLRLNEFIILNKKKYPSIYSTTQLIAGAKLLLPPLDVEETSGSIAGIGGRIIREEDKILWLQTRSVNSETGDFPLYINKQTKYENGVPAKIGECIIAIYDVSGSLGGSQALVIKKQ